MIDTETRRGPKIKGTASSAESEISFCRLSVAQLAKAKARPLRPPSTYPHFYGASLPVFFYQNLSPFRKFKYSALTTRA